MIRTIITNAVLVAGLLTQAPAALTPADAAPFIGQWTLALEGPNGPGTFQLTVKVDKEKVVGEIASDQMAAQSITDVTKPGKSLVLRYTFDYQGNNVDAVVQLTPGAEGKTAAQIDFAGGAYTMTGTATKKEKAQ